MTVVLVDPVLTVKDLLKNNWVIGNTNLTEIPQIHTGWYSEDQNHVQVSVTGGDERPVRGGETGFAGIAQGGAPAQIRGGEIYVDIWCHRDMIMGTSTPIPNPKDVRWNLSNEVMRIITANYQPADYLWLSFWDRLKITDIEKSPIIFRMRCIIRFGWHKSAT